MNWKQLHEIANNADYKTIADLNRQAIAKHKYKQLAVDNFAKVCDTLESVTTAFKRLLDKYEPDNNDYEWIGEVNETFININNSIK